LRTYKLAKPTQNLDLVTIKAVPEAFDSPKDAAGDSLMDEFERPWAIFGFCMLAAAYGTLHALAWHARFPSHRQRILWRVLSLFIASPAGAAFVIVTLALSISSIARFVKWALQKVHQESGGNELQLTVTMPSTEAMSAYTLQNTGDRGPKLFGVYTFDTIVWDFLRLVVAGIGVLSEWVFIGGLLVLYLPARAYVVGKSFRMAFYLPSDAFRATQWEKFFPHFG
jgi:hypothetical protein